MSFRSKSIDMVKLDPDATFPSFIVSSNMGWITLIADLSRIQYLMSGFARIHLCNSLVDASISQLRSLSRAI